MPDFNIINPIDIPEWDNHVQQFPEATIFHSSAWARVLTESYGFIPYYCVAYKGKKIVGILPLMEVRDIFGRRKGVSLPFTDFCEPLFEDQQCFLECFDHIKHIAQQRKWRSLELRGGQKFLSHEPAYDTMFTHDIDLSPEPEVIFKSFADTNRRNIRKAIKSGITITHDRSLESAKSFYFLNCLTRREHGLPPQPWKFFRKLWEMVITQEKGFITLASFQQKPVAANFYMDFGKKALYKYGASDRRFQHVRPSNLVMWEGIKKCRELQCKTINLGRTEEHHAGLLQFKRGWNGTELRKSYFRYDYATGRYLVGPSPKKVPIYSRFIMIAPIPILKPIGNLLTRYAG